MSILSKIDPAIKIVFFVVLFVVMGYVVFAASWAYKHYPAAQVIGTLNELHDLDEARQQWATKNFKHIEDVPTFNELKPYIKPDSYLAQSAGKDSLGNPFILDSNGKGVHVNPRTKEYISTTPAYRYMDPTNYWHPYD